MRYHYADIFETVAAAVPDAVALIHGDEQYSWSQFDRRSNAFAADLAAAGLGEMSKVGVYLYNDPAFLTSYYGSFKAGMCPFNINYRYGSEEIRYLLENSDAEAVVFHAEFAAILDPIRAEVPMVKRWYVVADGTEMPEWATPFESVVAPGAEQFLPTWGRDPEHFLLMYTGGTTGMPKGVMWPHADLFESLGRGGNPVLGVDPVTGLSELVGRIDTNQRLYPACPLMHGTGQFTAFVGMAGGAAVVTNPNRSFDAGELLRIIDRDKVTSLIIVGDAFARPIAAELDANRADYDLSSLFLMVSSGVMWSQEVKARLLEHLPTAILFDSYGSSEAVGLGTSVSTAGAANETARFQLGERVKVFTEDGKPVVAGSEDTGFVAIGGPQPLGYYKDEVKTAETFRVINGVRYSVPGDYAQVNADGSLHLLGRGSVCINTGGEKVFPEEVEEALKSHPSVIDAVCVGLPDERFGETICAVIEPASALDHDALVAYVRTTLARYKAPRDIVEVDTIGRAANGKVDYKRLKAHAAEVLGR
jgi:acyl-CoA synthetase (AMP-forming)/AMP-acid ligase II